MNYMWYYDFDNFEDTYKCMPAVRNGVCFSFLGCKVKLYTLKDPYGIFVVDSNGLSKVDSEVIYMKAAKLLSILFLIPFYSKENQHREEDGTIILNNLLSKKNSERIKYVEEKVLRLNAIKSFFDEIVDLLVIAFENLFKYRDEDAFVYFFKVIERLAKQYYTVYMQRIHTKSKTANNKNSLRDILKMYARDNLDVVLTEDMLDRKVDQFYKDIKLELYGSVFNKISLFINREGITQNIDDVSKMVKIRNKIAHGDSVHKDVLAKAVSSCEYLALQMFSKRFFRKGYEEIHVKSYRFFDKSDPYN